MPGSVVPLQRGDLGVVDVRKRDATGSNLLHAPEGLPPELEALEFPARPYLAYVPATTHLGVAGFARDLGWLCLVGAPRTAPVAPSATDKVLANPVAGKGKHDKGRDEHRPLLFCSWVTEPEFSGAAETHAYDPAAELHAVEVVSNAGKLVVFVQNMS